MVTSKICSFRNEFRPKKSTQRNDGHAKSSHGEQIESPLSGQFYNTDTGERTTDSRHTEGHLEENKLKDIFCATSYLH